LEKSDVKNIIKPRAKFNHKGNFGHALLIAGSYGKMGASVLGSRAALRSGLGLLTTHVPKVGYQIIQTAVPEAMASIDVSEMLFTSIPNLQPFNAIGVGPGLGQDDSTIKAFTSLLNQIKIPLVLDADAINILGSNRELIPLIPKDTILTPHPKEFERLVGSWSNDFERLEKQIEFSIKTKIIVLLKGANTSISTPEGKLYFNNTGNPGMATAGSGDVLTGIITGLRAQGYSAVEAALVGAWIHGLAGDCAAREKGEDSLIASDIIECLPEAFASFR
jgi:NAD(P)H-hydrate epimerase